MQRNALSAASGARGGAFLLAAMGLVLAGCDTFLTPGFAPPIPRAQVTEVSGPPSATSAYYPPGTDAASQQGLSVEQRKSTPSSRGSSSSSGDFDYRSSNTTLPSGNTTRPSGNTTLPLRRRGGRSGNTTLPSGNTTLPSGSSSNSSGSSSDSSGGSSNSSGNTTLPSGRIREPSGRDTDPRLPRTRFERGNTTFPQGAARNDDAASRVASGLGSGTAANQSANRPAAVTVAKERRILAQRRETDASGEVTTAVRALANDPLDWPYWRGPHCDGISPETGLADTFDPAGGEGSNVSWKRDDLGTRSTPIVMHGKLYTLARYKPGTDVEGERVICLDAATGDTIWETHFNVWLSDVPDIRVGWSSVVGDPTTGRIYAQGVCGNFVCLDGDTGDVVWSVPMHERFGLLSTFGGRTNFPILCDDLVIASGIVIGWGEMARPVHAFVGFDKSTGEVVWYRGTRVLPYDTSYSAPSIKVLAGQKALVVGSGDGAVWALQPRTGEEIWHFDFSRRGLNVPPLVVGNTVYAGHSEENIVGVALGAVVAIDGTGRGNITPSGALWRVPGLMMGKTAPAMVDDMLFCLEDSAKLHVVDAKTGEPIGRQLGLGTMMRASPLYADGKLFVIEANGRWYVIEPDMRAGARIVSRGRFPGEECSASPICSHGRLYLTTSGGIYCIEDKSKKPSFELPPDEPTESPVEDDPKVAHVQVVPADVLMKPGESVQFHVRLYNSKGQFLRESPAAFSVDGPGTISDEGLFEAPADAQHVAAIITANVDGVKNRARIRIVPPLPWHFDFEGLTDLPITWVGARYRHVIRAEDGNNVAVKITTIPKGTRSRCWFGHSNLHDYTITADVRGAITDGKMPDIGLIAQGYGIDMQGASQKLQIRSWVANPVRREKTVDFAWKADVWYTLKFRASVEDGKAVLKGKVWPRDAVEPDDWTVELVDDAPNVQGSPGLYGNAKDAEITLDNIAVAPND